jgi:hypothetical protein
MTIPAGLTPPAFFAKDKETSELESESVIITPYAPNFETAPVIVQPNIFVRDVGPTLLQVAASSYTVTAVDGRQVGDELWMFVNHNAGFGDPSYELSGGWTKTYGSSAEGCDIWTRIATGDSNDDFTVGFNNTIIVATKMCALGVSASAKAAGYDFPSISMLSRSLYNSISFTWYLWGTGTQDWMTQDNTYDPYSWVLLNTCQHRTLPDPQTPTVTDSPPYNMDEHIWDFASYTPGYTNGCMMGVVSFDYEATATSYQNYQILYTPNEYFFRKGVGRRYRLTFTPP